MTAVFEHHSEGWQTGFKFFAVAPAAVARTRVKHCDFAVDYNNMAERLC